MDTAAIAFGFGWYWKMILVDGYAYTYYGSAVRPGGFTGIDYLESKYTAQKSRNSTRWFTFRSVFCENKFFRSIILTFL